MTTSIVSTSASASTPASIIDKVQVAELMAQSANSLWRDVSADPNNYVQLEQNQVNSQLWGQLTDSGLHDILLAEANGGGDENWLAWTYLLREAGAAALPCPLLSSSLGRWLLEKNEVYDAPEFPESPGSPVSPVSIALGFQLPEQESARVLWGASQNSDALLLFTNDNRWHLWHRADTASLDIQPCSNLAGEPHGTIASCAALIEGHKADASGVSVLDTIDALLLASFGLTAMQSGAIRSMLDLSIDYVNERQQFGRALGKFQAIQQSLAAAAGELAAVTALVESSGRHLLNADKHTVTELMLACVRCSQAVHATTSVAHQVHGAIGFTREYRLQLFSRRLWAWDTDVISNQYWSRLIGQSIVDDARQSSTADPSIQVWTYLTKTDRH